MPPVPRDIAICRRTMRRGTRARPCITPCHLSSGGRVDTCSTEGESCGPRYRRGPSDRPVRHGRAFGATPRPAEHRRTLGATEAGRRSAPVRPVSQYAPQSAVMARPIAAAPTSSPHWPETSHVGRRRLLAARDSQQRRRQHENTTAKTPPGPTRYQLTRFPVTQWLTGRPLLTIARRC